MRPERIVIAGRDRRARGCERHVPEQDCAVLIARCQHPTIGGDRSACHAVAAGTHGVAATKELPALDFTPRGGVPDVYVFMRYNNKSPPVARQLDGIRAIGRHELSQARGDLINVDAVLLVLLGLVSFSELQYHQVTEVM